MTSATIQNCAETDLSIFEPSEGNPWNVQLAVHLFQRIQFGANITTVNEALLQTPENLVDQLVDVSGRRLQYISNQYYHLGRQSATFNIQSYGIELATLVYRIEVEEIITLLSLWLVVIKMFKRK